MTARHDLHLLSGTYALDALDDVERAAFEKHLEKCPSCREEVRGLRETAVRLGMATAIEPPPRMREQVLTAAARTRQLPPSGRRLRSRRAQPSVGQRFTLPRLATATAMAAMAAAIAVLAVLQTSTAHQLQTAQASNQAIAAVLAAPDSRISSSATTLGGTVTAVISPGDREAVITTTGMPAPPGTHVYQLWVISAAGARSAGVMPASNSGTTAPVLATDVQPGDHMGITVEPAGGSTHPTTTPIVLMPVVAL